MSFLRPKESKKPIEQRSAATSSSKETATYRGELGVKFAEESARIAKDQEERRKQEIRAGKRPEDTQDTDKKTRTRADVSSGDEDSKKRAEKRKKNPIISTLEENFTDLDEEQLKVIDDAIQLARSDPNHFQAADKQGLTIWKEVIDKSITDFEQNLQNKESQGSIVKQYNALSKHFKDYETSIRHSLKEQNSAMKENSVLMQNETYLKLLTKVTDDIKNAIKDINENQSVLNKQVEKYNQHIINLSVAQKGTDASQGILNTKEIIKIANDQHTIQQQIIADQQKITDLDEASRALQVTHRDSIQKDIEIYKANIRYLQNSLLYATTKYQECKTKYEIHTENYQVPDEDPSSIQEFTDQHQASGSEKVFGSDEIGVLASEPKSATDSNTSKTNAQSSDSAVEKPHDNAVHSKETHHDANQTRSDSEKLSLKEVRQKLQRVATNNDFSHASRSAEDLHRRKQAFVDAGDRVEQTDIDEAEARRILKDGLEKLKDLVIHNQFNTEDEIKQAMKDIVDNSSKVDTRDKYITNVFQILNNEPTFKTFWES